MAQLNISLPPPKESPDFDGWLTQVTQYLRDYLGLSYTDRGNPAVKDFIISDFTTDGTWKTGANALDFSSIVPFGAKAMLLRVGIKDNAVSTEFLFRKSGQSNDVNISQILTQVSGVWVVNDMILSCSADRKVEYSGTSTAIDDGFMVVKGWWI